MLSRSTIVAGLFVAAFAGQASAEPIVALGRGNILYQFDTATPGAVSSLGAVSLTASGESLVGLDFRPANNQLYALSDASRLYTISLSGAPAATRIGVDGAFTLSGTSFGFDFNPVADRIRVVSDADQNLRLNPNDGTLTAVDGTLAYAAGDVNSGVNPNIVAAAYSNNFAPSPRTTPGTTLYVLDSTLNIVATQDPPNAGTLNTVGGAGNPAVISGFDISGASGIGYANWPAAGGADTLFRIGLQSGGVTNLGVIGSGSLGIIDISVAQVPEPGTLSLLALPAGLAWIARRRRLREGFHCA